MAQPTDDPSAVRPPSVALRIVLVYLLLAGSYLLSMGLAVSSETPRRSGTSLLDSLYLVEARIPLPTTP